MNYLNTITPVRILLAVLVMTVSTFIATASAEPPPCREANPQVCQEQREARCRTMNEVMLKQMKATPLKTERDIKDVTELIERVEKMLSHNRSHGIDECRSWGDLNRIVVHQ
jgi:hypothetical protein